jgi:hypothetical protein
MLKCLQLVGREQEKQRKGGMVVISQLEFRRYLDKQMDPISAAACDTLRQPNPNLPLPNPHMPDSKERVLQAGEVDAVVVHSKYGLTPIELKAAGHQLDRDSHPTTTGTSTDQNGGQSPTADDEEYAEAAARHFKHVSCQHDASPGPALCHKL